MTWQGGGWEVGTLSQGQGQCLKKVVILTTFGHNSAAEGPSIKCLVDFAFSRRVDIDGRYGKEVPDGVFPRLGKVRGQNHYNAHISRSTGPRGLKIAAFETCFF